MGNPWLDETKARTWQPKAPGGSGLRGEHLEVLLALAAVHAPRRILDLGGGIGDLDAQFLTRFPEASLVCLDGSPIMLERCRATLADHAGRVTFVESDLAADWRAAVGAAFDVVFSVQSIHHLASEGKRACYAHAYDVLAPGGLFLLQERLDVDARFWPHLRALWALRGARNDAPGEEPSHADWLAAERAGGDFPEPLDLQITWLREIGFDAVETFARYADRAVLGGRRPPSAP